MTQIPSDGRCGFQTESGSPSQETIRHWRAVNRDFTYRRSESKDVAKLAAENHSHVSSFSDALKNVAYANPGIFQDPRRLWNLDETSVNCQYGVRTKVFRSSLTNHGGFIACQVKRTNKHMTLVVAIWAAGRNVPRSSY